MILNISNLSKKFNEEVLFNNVSFHINKNDRLAIVGKNGSGKTTLMNIMTGNVEADEGNIFIAKGTKVGTVKQFKYLNKNYTLYEEILSEKKDVLDLFNKASELELLISKSQDNLEENLKRHGDIIHRLEDINAYAYESEVKGILKGVGFSENDFNKSTDTLSGGELTRLELAKLLISKPDLLFLDEPTNHLDISSITWLENYLNNINATIVIISHDRYFIDKICNKVLGIKNKTAEIYNGNYSDYVTKSESVYKAKLKAYEKQQNYIEKQQEIIEKFRRYGSEKYIKKAKSREKLLSHIEEIDNPYEKTIKISFDINSKKISGNDVLSISNLSKKFDNKELIIDSDMMLKRGEKVAIIGDNGCGKTTLLKMIIGEEDYIGDITIGSNVEIGYYDQKQEYFNYTNSIFEEIHDIYPDMREAEIRNVLAKFGFYGEDVYKIIESLSGGERARVKLCILFLQRPNFLILDEPTNHLDFDSKESLEELILNFDATVLFVSHDRYFINKVTDRIICFQNKKLVNYYGDYDYFIEKSISNNEYKKSNEKITTNNSEKWKEQKKFESNKRRLENKLNKLYEEATKIEKKIEELDLELNDINNSTNFIKLEEIHNEKESLENELLDILENIEEIDIKVSNFSNE